MKKVFLLLRIIAGAFFLFSAYQVISIKSWPTVGAQTTSDPAMIQSLSGDELVMPNFTYTFKNQVFNSRNKIYLHRHHFTSLESDIPKGKSLPAGSKLSLHVNPDNPAQYYFPGIPPSHEIYLFAITITTFIFLLIPWLKIFPHNNSFKPTRAHTARAA